MSAEQIDRRKLSIFLENRRESLTATTLADAIAWAAEDGQFDLDPPIETCNDFGVRLVCGDLAFGVSPTGYVSHSCALRLAAWIVAIADPGEETFQKVLEAVKNT